MKKLLIIAFAVASLATAFTSCKKDVSEEELLKNQLAQADSLLKRGGVIRYTVKVVSTANSSMLKSKMSIENASVTVYQNDKVYTGQTDAMGFVTFDNMRVGTVAVNITLKDHAEVDYVADITPQEQLSNLSQSQVVNTIRYASTMVPMFPIADPGCATITGKVTAELDLTNTTPEPAPGVKVTATVDVDNPDFVSRYIAPTLSSGTPSAGRILKYAFALDNEQLTATTDAQGVYTLKVPASVNGLPIRISVADYQTTQKLYLENDPATGEFKPGSYSVSTLYSNDAGASTIPSVSSTYLIVDSPNSPFGKVISEAQFSYMVDANGSITSVTVINKGKFTGKPAVIAYNFGKNALLDPTFKSDTGEIESVQVVNGGSGYKDYNNGSFIRAFMASEYITAKFSVETSSNGYITKVNLDNQGYGYVYPPKYTFITTEPCKKIPTIDINMYPWKQILIAPTVTYPGEGIKKINNYPLTPTNLNYKNSFNVKNQSSIINNIFLGTGLKD